MTLRGAEKVTGLTIQLTYYNGKYTATAKIGDDTVVYTDHLATKAIKSIVDVNYLYVCHLVDKQQNYRCAKCGEIRPLQHHHKRLRSHGRIDSVENIEALCAPCHKSKHGG